MKQAKMTLTTTRRVAFWGWLGRCGVLMTSLVTVTAGNQTPIFTCEGRGWHLYGYRYSSFFFLQIDHHFRATGRDGAGSPVTQHMGREGGVWADDGHMLEVSGKWLGRGRMDGWKC